MNKTELRKYIADNRRACARESGFRQSSYINFKVANGFFFCLLFSNRYAELTVKPLYADELWLDIIELPEEKKAPVSQRGLGHEALPGQVLETFKMPDESEIDKDTDLKTLFNKIFREADAEIQRFLDANPNSDLFIPDETKTDDKDRLLYLVTLIHSGREKEVLSAIRHERIHRPLCLLRAVFTDDKYSYIKRWCKRNTWIGKLRNKCKPIINRIIRFRAFVLMAIENSKDDNPFYHGTRILDTGCMILTIVIPNIILLHFYRNTIEPFNTYAIMAVIYLWVFFKINREKKARRYYREFLKLPKEKQRKWRIGSWIATIAIYIVIFFFFYLIIELPKV